MRKYQPVTEEVVAQANQILKDALIKICGGHFNGKIHLCADVTVRDGEVVAVRTLAVNANPAEPVELPEKLKEMRPRLQLKPAAT